MEISRSTFTRLLERARKKVAAFLIEGKELSIEGGRIHFRTNVMKCLECGNVFTTSFEHSATTCPVCKSKDLVDMAGGFGHGRCCLQYNALKEGT